MNKKTINKTVKQSPAVVKGKSKKAWLIVLASVLGATTITFGSLYAYERIKDIDTAQQTEETRKFIDLVNNLNENSTSEQIAEAVREYGRLTSVELSILPKQTVDRFNKQKSLFEQDKKDAEHVDELVEALDNTTDTKLEITGVSNSYKNLTPRGKTLVESDADTKIQEALAAFQTDKEKVDAVVTQINQLGINCKYSDLEDAGDAWLAAKAEIRRDDLTATLQTTAQTLRTAQLKYNDDKEKVEDYSDTVNALIKESATKEQITSARELEASATEVQARRNETEFQTLIDTAKSKLDEIDTAYNEDAAKVTEFEAAIKQLDKDKSIASQIENADSKREAAETVKRSDLLSRVAVGAKTLKDVKDAYNGSKDVVTNKQNAISEILALDEKITANDITNAKKAISDIQNIIKNRPEPDWISSVTTLNGEIATKEAAYNADRDDVNAFVVSVDSLKIGECDEADIIALEDAYDNFSTLQRTDLVEILDEKYEVVAAERASYNVEKAAYDKYDAAVTELESKTTTCTKTEIQNAKNLGKAVVTKRLTLSRDKKVLDKKVEDIDSAYSTNEQKVVELENNVEDLNDNKTTCTQNDIDSCTAQVTALSTIENVDLVARINAASDVVSSIQDLYDADAAKLDDLEGKVQELNDKTSKDSEIKAAETLLEEVKAGAGKRGSDFTTRISSADSTIHQRRHYYDRDVGFIDDLVEWTNNEGSNPKTPRLDFINVGGEYKSFVEDIVREDLLSQASAAIAGFDAKFEEVEKESEAAANFNTKVNSLTSTSTDAEIKAVEALRPTVEKIQRRDIIDDNHITTNISKLESIRAAYNEDVVSSQTLFDEIDSFYNATVITQSSVDSVRSDYEIASARVKTLADTKCQEERSKGIDDIFGELDTALTEGGAINSDIAEFPGAYSSFQDSQKIHLLKFLPEYDAIDQTSFKWKVITANNKTKVETLRAELAAAKFEKISDVTLSGTGIVQDSESSVTDEYFNKCSSATVVNNTQAEILTIDASTIADWKTKYSTVVCYLYVETSTGIPNCTVCNSAMAPVGGNAEDAVSGKFYKIYIDLTSDGLTTPTDVTFYLMNSANSAIKLTSIYGTPNS